MKKKHLPMVRGLGLANYIIFGALFLTGGIMAIFRAPSSAATVAANNGARSQPGQPEPLQDLHEGLASVMILIAIVGGAWLMVRIHEDWSGRLAAAAGVGMIAVLSGLMVRFEAVQIDGVFESDLNGLAFIFDGGLDQVTFGGRAFGANVYRIWVFVHLVSAMAMIVFTAQGLRDIRKEPEPLVRVRPTRAERVKNAG